MMGKKSWKISRRTMLRATGVSMALPLLSVMEPSLCADVKKVKPPTRMAFLFMPNGVNSKQWTPTSEGKKFELSKTLAPLKNVKDDILVLTNLWNRGSRSGDGHYVKTSGLLTGTTITKTTGKDLRSGGISVDQVAAQKLGHHTSLPSLELGTDPVTSGTDTNVGYTRVYGSHIAWRSETTPLAKEINAQSAFDRLFRTKHNRKKNAKLKPDSVEFDNKSILDLVLEDAKNLNRKVGQQDRRKIEEYLESVRSLEKRIAHAFKYDKNNWQPTSQPNLVRPQQGRPSDYQTHVRLMMDIMLLAFQSDTTRISTFMFGNSVSGRNFSFLDGVKGGFHHLSHHQNRKEKLAQYQLINKWHIEQYAYLLEKMAKIDEGGQSLLDSSMIMFGSGLRDGNSHNNHNLPIVLAGKGGGLKTGQHLVYSRDTPLCNLYVAMLNGFGVNTKRFADSTEKLPKLI